ncbi:synaptotagmin-like protein 2 [Oreochromis aureus]|uniref:synaptotagmin-like protein 2 n=1 Tax=Oreochromis aureus TaxID=47969 RepID=UPI0019542780|nr:synaptotagmin-like protein 2 [Oreochromis aureus]
MIDLSFLTKDEQETILTVLKRDAELKQLEDQRVQNLQKSVMNKSQLRYLTGEWFYETKQLRHQDRIHGSDIIRASMRRTHKLKTILELSQVSAEKCSFVSTQSKEVSLPAVRCGVLREPHMELSNNHYQNQNLDETQQETLKSNSRMKQIKNPFNSEPAFEEKESQGLDEAVNQTQTKQCYRKSSSPITPALKRLSSRSRSSSKSLENLTLTSQTRNDHHCTCSSTL